jgi:hypothetical protein
MADYTGSKKNIGGDTAVPTDSGIETSWDHAAPLITPEQVRIHHLFGIPLVSGIRDTNTGKRQVMTDAIIKQVIDRAVTLLEFDSGVDIFPIKRREKYPFDRNLYEQLGYVQLHHRPVASVDKFSVTPSNGVDVYVVPLDWVEAAYLSKGQVNIVPLTIAFQNGGFIPSQSSGGAAFLAILGQRGWIPAYWQFEYTCGFPDGNLPKIINELIGVYTALEILDMLAATHAEATSHSLGIDGLSQSVSTPGPEIFSIRTKSLSDKRDKLLNRLKTHYGSKIFVGTV